MRACLLLRIIPFFITFASNKTRTKMTKDLFKSIDTAIRNERLYANVDLMREDIMRRFGIGRHRLNNMLNAHANGMAFPQYINAIRMEEAYALLTGHPEMTITDIARQVGFTAPNLREQFKRKYGMSPTEYRETHTHKKVLLNNKTHK